MDSHIDTQNTPMSSNKSAGITGVSSSTTDNHSATTTQTTQENIPCTSVGETTIQDKKKSQSNYQDSSIDDMHPIQNILSAELKEDSTGRNVKKALISADILSNMLAQKCEIRDSTLSPQIPCNQEQVGTASNSQQTVASSKKVSCNRHLYLCSPDYLELKYVINPWMDLHSHFSVEKAKSQWEELVAVYKKLVPDSVTVVPAKENLTEICFFGDSVFAYKDKATFGRFAKIERFAETEYVMAYLKEKGIHGERVPEHMHYEGSGETMLWNNKILVGYGCRNSIEIISYLQSHYELEVIGLQLVDPEFYHLDTALFPISNDLIAIYEDAFSEESKKIINSLGCEIMHLTYKDAKEFALNSTVIGKHVIVHYEAENFIHKLQDKGFIVHPVDVSEFIKFGGGLKCLTFQHYLS